MHRAVVHIAHRFPQHLGHSGYHQLSSHVPGARVADPAGLGAVGRITARALHVANSPRLSPGRGLIVEAAASELVAAARTLPLSRPTVCHYLYGEDSLGWMRPTTRRRLVATLHQPPGIIRTVFPHPESLRQLAAAIALGTRQADMLREHYDGLHVEHVPHGVDTTVFAPAGERSDHAGPWRCILVGGYLRDWNTFNGVTSLCRRRHGRSIRFTVITTPDNIHSIDVNDVVEVRTGVPEQELVEAYRGADVALLPLTTAVASNAVLEALACGTPLVVSDVGDTGDYVTSETAVRVPPFDPRALYEAVAALLSDGERGRRLSRAACLHVQRFSWPAVAARTAQVYEAVA